MQPRCQRRHSVAPSQRIERTFVFLCGFLLAGLLPAAAVPAASAAEAHVGTTSTAARQDAVRKIPFDRLDADARAKATSVINANGLFRRLPVEVVECDPNLYVFLLRHPEVVVEMWQLMGVTDMNLRRTGPESFHAADGAGTTGHVEFLYGDQQTHILYVDGQYRGPLYPRAIAANCVLVLHSRYARTADGRYIITSQLDTFVSVKNFGVELIAKTLQNVFGHTSDHNFYETAQFVSKLSHAAEVNTPGVEMLAARLTRLDAATRAQFVQVAAGVARRAESRRHLEGEVTVTRDEASR